MENFTLATERIESFAKYFSETSVGQETLQIILNYCQNFLKIFKDKAELDNYKTIQKIYLILESERNLK